METMTLQTLRQLLHAHPENSMGEAETREILMRFLREESDFMVVDRGLYFYAVKRAAQPEQPPIAFRADMDAVCIDGRTPGHYCGHDGHSSILAGLARELSGRTLSRDVYLIFQPGEETGEGALVCRELLKEKQIAEIYGLHNIPSYPLGQVLLRRDTFACASVGLSLRFMGKTSHAAYPEQGNNPALPMARLLTQLTEAAENLRAPGEILMLTVVGMQLGSEKYGVSAGEGSLFLTLRGERESHFQALLQRCRDLAEACARDHGLQLEITEHERFPATENHEDNVFGVKAAAVALGMTVRDLPEPMRWSEDFGYYLQDCAGAFFGLGAGEETPSLHTREYEFPDALLEKGIALFAALADPVTKIACNSGAKGAQ